MILETKNHPMKVGGVGGEVQVKLYACLSSALDVDRWSTSGSSSFISEERITSACSVKGWVNPKAFTAGEENNLDDQDCDEVHFIQSCIVFHV
jgi:hypothetical protein